MIPLLRRTPLKRRPLTYRRRMRRARARAMAPREPMPVVEFEPPRGELPVATLHGAHAPLRTQMAVGLGRWIAARLAWLRPRAVPVAVALVGMFAVLNAVNYLAKAPPAKTAAASLDTQPAYSFHVKLVLQQ